ncbi:hypothetical protein JCM8547_006955 [Rhodosporidiobolus lusitaniae]
MTVQSNHQLPDHHHLPFPSSSPSSAPPPLALSQLSHPFCSRVRTDADAPSTAVHPTHALLHSPSRHAPPSSSLSNSPTDPSSEAPSSRLTWRWTSRAHRKGVPPQPVVYEDSAAAPRAEKAEGGKEKWEVRQEGKSARGWKDAWRFMRETRWWGWDLGDISWWVAFIFTIGSVFWCINGIMFFCYFSNTSATFYSTEAAFAFLGGTTFWVGAYLGWVESLNPAELAGDFGWEVREEGRHVTSLLYDDPCCLPVSCRLLLQPRKARPSSSLGLRRRHFGSFPSQPLSSSTSTSTSVSSTPSSKPKWRWFALPTSSTPPNFPVSWKNLGYLANAIQFFGGTAFQVSVLCGLPGVLPESGSVGGPEQEGRAEREWIAAYWAMQVLGAPCFIIAGLIFMVEVQRRWYIPNLKSIGWHIGIWNVIGGWGFLFSAIFGIWRQTSIADPSMYQYWGTAFSTFWGSWAFLIGSYIQLLETLNKWT